MAKNKSKKRSKGKKSKGVSPHVDVADPSDITSINHNGNFNDVHRPIWSTADECAHYTALGCHIANIARCGSSSSIRPASKSNKSSSKQKNSTNSNSNSKRKVPLLYTCSEYEKMYDLAMQQHEWLLGMERFDPSEYHPEDIASIPEVAMDDGDNDDGEGIMTLTLTNVTKETTNICFVTVYDVDVCDANGNVLKSGTSSITTTTSATVASGIIPLTVTKERKCTTFIVLCPPQTFVHLCSLANETTMTEQKMPITSWSQVEIESDVQPWSSHSNVDDDHPHLLHFPFHSTDTKTETETKAKIEGEDNVDATKTKSYDHQYYYQCTQSENGQLTHFFHGNYHAIDFACPIGTPLYSPANGVVVDVHVHDKNNVKGGEEVEVEVSGIAARNLFHWNSVMIRVVDDDDDDDDDDEVINKNVPKDPLYVEFVHIESNSCVVQVGDVVQKGQLICNSGSVGFSPEPHLHLAAYRSNGDEAATVRVRFECAPVGTDGGRENEEKVSSFLPRAGGWYNRHGLTLI